MASSFSKSFILFLLSVVYLVSTEELDEDTIVQLKEGKIRGHIQKSGIGRDYYAFQEIPYAAPPVGENRLRLPKKVSSWEGVLNTTKNTKICYQWAWFTRGSNFEISEDCLFINVYTPVKPSGNSSKLPVLVWIHGGGYLGESGTAGPKYIMDYGVVVVTFNYRLGPFGFATTEDETIPANLGLKDQKFALEWVNENIHLFSGDADQVTIIGESSGAWCVGLHVLGQRNNEKAELFRAAIMQSGSPLGGLVQFGSPRGNIFTCGRFLNKNVVSNNSTDLLRVLQEASAADFLAACSGATGPVIEKEGDFSYHPLESLMNGEFKKVPVLIGFTSEELLMVGLFPFPFFVGFLDNTPGSLVSLWINMSNENRTIAGQLIKKVYTNDSFVNDTGAYVRWTSDNLMNLHVCKQADLLSSEVPVFLYQFSYYGDLGGGQSVVIPGTERVAHSADVHYMWDLGTNSDLSIFPENDGITLQRFVKMWTNFVKYLNPTPENDILLNNVTWPATDNETLRYLNFNETLEIREYPRKYKEVKTILDQYMEPPYTYY